MEAEASDTRDTRQRHQTASASAAEGKESTIAPAKVKKTKAAEKAAAEKAASERVAAERAAADRAAAEKAATATAEKAAAAAPTEKTKTLTTPAHATKPKDPLPRPESAARQQARRNVREQVGGFLTPAYDDDDTVFYPRARSPSYYSKRRRGAVMCVTRRIESLQRPV